MSWTQAIPAEGHLVLTYASSLKGCEAVWPERIKLRKFTCIPKAAPLPPEAGVDHGLHTLGFPISYTAFIRLVSSEAPLEETFGKAIHQAEDVFAQGHIFSSFWGQNRHQHAKQLLAPGGSPIGSPGVH